LRFSILSPANAGRVAGRPKERENDEKPEHPQTKPEGTNSPTSKALAFRAPQDGASAGKTVPRAKDIDNASLAVVLEGSSVLSVRSEGEIL